MKLNKNTDCFNHSLEDHMPILSIGDSGTYVLRLPKLLKPEQNELEQMLERLFAGGINSPDNLALAQQLSLNWCTSKAKKNGLVEKCLCRPVLSRTG